MPAGRGRWIEKNCRTAAPAALKIGKQVRQELFSKTLLTAE
jgi:hypothetical protein